MPHSSINTNVGIFLIKKDKTKRFNIVIQRIIFIFTLQNYKNKTTSARHLFVND